MDFQNEMVSTAQGKDPGILDRAAAVIGAARGSGLAVVYVVVRFRQGYPEISPRNRGFSALKTSGRLLEGTPGAEIHPRVAPAPGEVVVVKRRVGAFSTTDLAAVLRGRDITTLVLMGISTSGVVLSTVRWAADADYRLVVVEDCCADADDEVHRVLTQKVFPRQASVVQANALLAALSGAPSSDAGLG
jgi:nicotinamidase-related amidase